MNIIETNLGFGSLSKRKATNKIIIHHADALTCSIKDIHSWHKQKGWSGAGYHFFIRTDGSVYRGRPMDTIGSHCEGQNANSIGICFEGRLTLNNPTNEQLTAAKELIANLKSIYGNIPVDGHKKFKTTDCPGLLMDYMDELNVASRIPATTEQQPVLQPVQDNKVKYSDLQAELNAQLNAGLVVDNIPGPKTLAACPTIKEGARGGITKWIQKKINELGFNCGNADGTFGSMTLAAVKAFQKSKGLIADGIIGKNTWRKLLGL